MTAGEESDLPDRRSVPAIYEEGFMRLLLTLAAALALSLPALAGPCGLFGCSTSTTKVTTTTRTTSSTRTVAAPACATTAANFAPPASGPTRAVAVAAWPVRTVARAVLTPVRRLFGRGCN